MLLDILDTIVLIVMWFENQVSSPPQITVLIYVSHIDLSIDLSIDFVEIRNHFMPEQTVNVILHK